MPRSEAQIRADKKYKSRFKQWEIRLTPEEFAIIEEARGNVPKRQWLLKIAKENRDRD